MEHKLALIEFNANPQTTRQVQVKQSTKPASLQPIATRAVSQLATCYFLVLLLTSVQGTQAQSLPFQTLASDDGLAQSVVLTMMQDSSGYLWFGTPSGISRFDGLKFKNFSEADGLPNDVVRALLQDRQGSLWAGTDAGLARLHDDVWQTLTSLPEAGVRCLVEDQDGVLWVGTWGAGVVRLAPSGATILGTAQGLPHLRVRAALRDRGGRLWFGTWGGGVALRTAEGKIETFGTPNGLDNLFIRALLEDRVGRLLAATNKGLFRFEEGRFQAYLRDAPEAGGAITSLLEDRVGRLWFGTRDHGACRVDETRVDETHVDENGLACYQTEDGLADNSLNTLLQDREGNLWFGTFGGGVSRLGSEGFRSYTQRNGLPSASVPAFVQGADDVLWVGTHGGGLANLRNGTFVPLETTEGMPHSKILSADRSPDGTLWFGTLSGAVHLQGNQFTTLGVTEGLAHEVVHDLAVDAEGSVWFATLEGLSVLKAGEVRTYTTAEGLPANRVNTVLPAADASLWIGTEAGLTKFSEHRMVTWSEADGLADGFVNDLYESPDGSLWIATAGGLSHLRNGSFTTYTTSQGLSHDNCTAVAGDDLGRIWVGTTRGVNFFDGERFTVFTRRDSLPSSEVNRGATLVDHSDRVWFGTIGGATVFEPGLTLPQRSPPSVHITSLEVEGHPLPPTADLRLEHNQNDLRFEFVGISLSYPDEVEYSTLLEGLDVNWRNTTSRAVDFPALPPGEYTFTVRARHRDGPWSESPAHFSFVIEPPFWQTISFRSAFALLLIGLVVGGHKLRLRSLEKQKTRLEDLVRQRTAELERLNDQKSEFLGIAAHDLRSPLGGIMGYVDLLLRFLDEDRLEKPLWRRFLGNVRTTTDQMHTLVNDLLDVTAIETGRLELRLDHLSMADLLKERESFQLPAAQEKDIQLLVQTESAEVEILADHLRLGEVLDNLMTNALKYTASGGRVRVSCETNANELITHVEDTGQGIAPEELPLVFSGRPLSNRPTAGEKSTGFGLLIVKKLVEAHGGRIWVESVKDRGSTFSFSLPRGGR